MSEEIKDIKPEQSKSDGIRRYCYFDGCKNRVKHEVEDIDLWWNRKYHRYVCDKHFKNHLDKQETKKAIKIFMFFIFLMLMFILIVAFIVIKP